MGSPTFDSKPEVQSTMEPNQWKNMDAFLGVYTWADEEMFRFCFDLGQEIRVPAGEMMFHNYDDVRGVYLLWHGHLKTVVPNTNGETISGIHTSGSVLGLADLLSTGSHQRSAVALNDVTVILIYKSEFLHSLARHPSISFALMRQMNEELSELELRATNLIQQPSAQRLANSLVTLGRKFGTDKEGRLKVVFSPRDLANLICTTRTTIYRLLRQFENEGLIRMDQKGIKLISTDQLMERARV